MKLKIQQLIFGIGTILVLASSYFSPRLPNLFWALFFGGSLLCIFTYVFVLFSKQGLRIKILWAMILLGVWPLWILSSPHLEKIAYQHFYRAQERNLQAVVDLLADKNQDIYFFQNRIQSKLVGPEQIDTTKVLALKKDLKLAAIYKTDCWIFFEIGGFLDNRRGVYYHLKNNRECSTKIPAIAWMNESWYCAMGF